MDDVEVTRSAFGMAFESLFSLQLQSNDGDSRDILKEYILLCPFVPSYSPAIAAALSNLDKCEATRSDVLHLGTKGKSAPLAAHQAAFRVMVSALHDLMLQSETEDHLQLMKQYILLCPYVEQDSEVVRAAIQGIEEKAQGPPALFGESDSDSEREQIGDPDSNRKREQVPLKASVPLKAKEPVETSKFKPETAKKSRPLVVLLRSILLDAPIVILFAAYLGILWLDRVNVNYLTPQYEAVIFNDERAEEEITYFERVCDARDMTTNRGTDLFLSPDSTVNEAYEHNLRNGFTVFPSVLSHETAANLRAFVDSRNRELTASESIFVIEGTNRFSFGLGTEEPTVVAAVKEVATHKLLAPAIEKIIGPDPALIEMTAITSSAGAVAQYWHDDVVAVASALKYGRTFSPSYSVFIQLQNTTRQMGATSACPGSHLCSGGRMDEFCEQEGFQLVRHDTGYWATGDALLMNMNSWHRGAAHTDYDAPDRVMFILTFASKPVDRAESRQMSQGITFSLRWDMWGHTLSDLAHAETAMSQPWATLRSLGLYKKEDAVWGIDYISSSTMRMANEDNGFRQDELYKFLDLGGFFWLPWFLHGDVYEGDSWYEFLVNTLDRCETFMFWANGVALAVYAVVFLCFGIMSPKEGHFRKAVSRLFCMYFAVFVVWQLANYHVDNTDWARDIKGGRRYTSVFDSAKEIPSQLRSGPSTFPNRLDVLVETKYGSKHLAMYNDFILSHPGNSEFRKLVRDGAVHYKRNSDFFREAAAKYIVNAMTSNQGRFLHQDQRPVWTLLSEADALDYTKAELAVQAAPLLRALRQQVGFLTSDVKYGSLRDTAMGQKWSILFLADLRRLVLLDTPVGNAVFTSLEEKIVTVPTRTTSKKFSTQARVQNVTVGNHRLVRSPFVAADVPVEPFAGAWLKAGDEIEGSEVSETGEPYWYPGSLTEVTASGYYEIVFDDGAYATLERSEIRPFKPYRVGEEVEVLESEFGEGATIVSVNENGTYDLFLMNSQEIVEDVGRAYMRRERPWRGQ